MIIEEALEKLHQFNLDPYNKIDNFFQLWIDILIDLNRMSSCGKEEKDTKILKCVDFDRLPTAVKVSFGLFNAFKKQIDAGFPQDCDKGFFKKLKDAVDGKVSEPEDTSSGPASVPDVSLNSLSQTGGNGSEPKDTSGELFSSILKDAGPQIEEINELIGVASTDPAFSALSTFLSDKDNWTKFSGIFKNDINMDWCKSLNEGFIDLVLKPFTCFQKDENVFTPESNHPPLVDHYKKTGIDLSKFAKYPVNVDDFLPLWIRTLKTIKLLRESENDQGCFEIR